MKLSDTNFTVLHGINKDMILTEADNFRSLSSALAIYRNLNYSNISVFHPKEKGLVINNIPQTGKQTGFMEFDVYGCWYEVKPDDGSENFLMIGEYPCQY